VSLIPVATMVLLALLLYKYNWKSKRNRIKIIAFSLALAAQVLTFIHYFFIVEKLGSTTLVLMCILTAASQYLLTYYCAQESCRLLQNKDKWLKMLKVVGVVAFMLYVALFTYQELKSLENSRQKLYLSCTKLWWIVLNCT